LRRRCDPEDVVACGPEAGIGTLIAVGLGMTRLLVPSLVFVILHVILFATVLAIIVSN
jgi:hypothetical protein